MLLNCLRVSGVIHITNTTGWLVTIYVEIFMVLIFLLLKL